MPYSCAVATCPNTYRSSTTTNMLSFFTFPKEESLKNIWIKACQRTDKFNVTTARICSAHFLASDFERNFQAELLNYKSRPALKKGTIPTVNLSLKHSELSEEKTSCQNEDPENQRCQINKGEESKHKSTVSTIKNVRFKDNEQGKCQTSKMQQIHLLKSANVALMRENEILKRAVQVKDLALRNCRRKIRTLSTQKNHWQKKITKTLNKSVSSRMIKPLEKVFTKNQLDMVLKKKKVVHWDEIDICCAFALRYLSKRAYIYLRDDLNYPLPGISTLEKWASKVAKEDV